jgi:hypothetical protein
MTAKRRAKPTPLAMTRRPTEDEAREASRVVDAWLDDRQGVTEEQANQALLVVDAYFKPARRARLQAAVDGQPCRSSCTLEPEDDGDGGRKLPVRRAS